MGNNSFVTNLSGRYYLYCNKDVGSVSSRRNGQLAGEDADEDDGRFRLLSFLILPPSEKKKTNCRRVGESEYFPSSALDVFFLPFIIVKMCSENAIFT